VQGASLAYFVQKYYKKKVDGGNHQLALDIRTKGKTLAEAKENLSAK